MSATHRPIAYRLIDDDLGVIYDIDDHTELRGILDLLFPPDNRHWHTANVMDFLCSIPGEYLWSWDGRDALAKLGFIIEPDRDTKGTLVGNSWTQLHEYMPEDLKVRMKAVVDAHRGAWTTWDNREHYQSAAFRHREKNPPGGIRIFVEDERYLRAAQKATGGSIEEQDLLDLYITMLDRADLVRYPNYRARAVERFVADNGREPNGEELSCIEFRASELAQREVYDQFITEPINAWHDAMQERFNDAGMIAP